MSILKVFDNNKASIKQVKVENETYEKLSKLSVKPQKTQEQIKSFMLIDQEADVHGRINSAGDVVIEGRFEGEITARNLTVRQGGLVNARVHVQSAWIDGTLTPEIACEGLLTIHASGRVIGKINYSELIVEKGGKCRGHMDYDDQNESLQVY
jgi:cytoskeletal protein CcmA (bactofilin family)